MGIGKLQATLNAQSVRQSDPIRLAEFKVFSQFGDDGIIQHLLHHIEIPRSQQTFVEFGVENYLESNTRFLLVNNNWRGLVIDGSFDNIKFVRDSELYWKYDLTALSAFIDRDNINDLLRRAEITGPIGILSIDIDGNDYWVWDQIDVVQPSIVIAEYNSVFGADRAITIPTILRSSVSGRMIRTCIMAPRFQRSATCMPKRLRFIGCNTAGNNSYFLRRELLGDFRELTAQEGYVESRFRECERPGTTERLRGI